MTDKKKLMSHIILHDITCNELAEKVGISHASLSYKMNSRREFTGAEIKQIRSILKLDAETTCDIFFA